MAFSWLSAAPTGVTGDRRSFLGRHGSVSRPAALRAGGLDNRLGAGLDPCTALKTEVVIEPGATATLTWLIGQTADRDAARQLIEQLREPAAVQDASARAAYFPGFDFAAAPALAFDAGGRAIVLDSLVGRMLAQGVATEPDAAGVRGDLDALITRLAACGGSCPAGRTGTIVKASCAALLGSAVTLVH